MQRGEVTATLEKIKTLAHEGDHEAASAKEHELYFDVLNHIALNAHDIAIRAIAREALKSKTINFDRVTA